MTPAGFRLVAHGLRLHLGERDLLNGVDLTVAPGDLVAVTGPSGTGKTSLLLILAGVLEPDAGSVAFEPAAGDDPAPVGQPLIALVPQTLALSPRSTAAENVALPLQVRGVEPAETRERVMAALESVGLGATSDRLVTELSGGQRQRVAVARALAMRADVLIADEATAELDAENQRLVMGLLEEQAGAGVAIVVATHDTLVAERCSRSYLLEQGQLEPGLLRMEAPATLQ
ncbi:MAG: ABC transporter ATP-binding protein [Acidimicrobiales bacterium]